MARLALISAFACLASQLPAQSPDSLDLTAVGKDSGWKIFGRTTSIVDMKGKHALHLSGSLGVWVGEGSGGYFANLRVTRTR